MSIARKRPAAGRTSLSAGPGRGERRAGRHAFDVAEALARSEETPLIGIGRRELRNGRILFAVAVVVLLAAIVAGIGLAAFRPVWHGWVTLAFCFSGVTLGQSIRMIRDGRATLRDELRRQMGSTSRIR